MHVLAEGKLATGKVIRGVRAGLETLLRRSTPELRELRDEPIVELQPRLSRWLDDMSKEHKGGKVLGKPTSARRILFARPVDPARHDEAFAELIELIMASGRWAPHRVQAAAAASIERADHARFEPAPRRAPDLLWPPPYSPELTVSGNGWGDDPDLIVVALSLRTRG